MKRASLRQTITVSVPGARTVETEETAEGSWAEASSMNKGSALFPRLEISSTMEASCFSSLSKSWSSYTWHTMRLDRATGRLSVTVWVHTLSRSLALTNTHS